VTRNAERTLEEIDVMADAPAALETRLLTRAEILKLGAAGASALALSRLPFGAGSAAAAGLANSKLILSSAGGVYTQQWRTAIFNPFTKATGIDIVNDDTSALLPKLQAQVGANQPASDLTELVLFDHIQALKLDLLRPMPTALYTKLQKVSQPGWVTKYGIMSGAGTTNVIASNIKTVPTPPKTPADFFNPSKFPGRRAMWADGYVTNIVTALLADGVTKAKLFPLDVDRAFRKLDQIRSAIKVWYTTGDQQQQILRDNEVDMLLGWDGRLFNLKRENTVGLALSFSGAMSGPRVFSVPKAAPNPAGAWKFTDWFGTNPRKQGVLTTMTGYPGPNKKGVKFVAVDVAARLWTSPAYLPQVLVVDPGNWHEDIDALKARWYGWLQR
jgi:putative spermidine/putrescine transport system substrate-binding protein